MKRLFLLMFIQLLPLSAVVFAQQKVTGKVFDENGQPLIGATIHVKGGTAGAVTDVSGNFELNISGGDSIIVATYVGYVTEEYKVKSGKPVDITLLPNLMELQQVVVIGYGSTKKADLTSSITTVKSDELAKLPVTSLEQSLQGKAAGVTVVQSGSPGGGASIRIRGTNSPNGTDPLWVVDGLIGAPSPNANDVESMQILKDAAACAIYGSRGSNGVIIVTTKKGVKGEPKITFKSYFGKQVVDNKIDMMSGDQFIQFWETNKKVNEYIGPNGDRYPNELLRPGRVDSATANPSKFNANTDWLSQIYRTSYTHNLNFSISNGSDQGNYFASVDNRKEDGVQIGSGFNQTGLQVNSELKKSIFKIGENLNIIEKQYSDNDSRLVYALRQSPLLAVRNAPSGSLIEEWPGNSQNDNSNNPNPVADITNSYNKRIEDVILGSVFIDIEFMKGLNFRTDYGLQLNNTSQQSKKYMHLDGESGPQIITVGMSMSGSRYISKQFENILTYKTTFSNSNITLMGGYTRENNMVRSLETSYSGFNVDDPESYASKIEGNPGFIGGNFSESSLESFLGRIMYDYKSRYYLTANIRRDGTSKFSKGHKWSTFPSVSLGWRISDETFMKNIAGIDNLKLRGSYGSIGSQSGIKDYNTAPLAINANYVLNNTLAQGITQSGIVDENLHWETTYSSNIGFDLEMWHGMFSLTTDYFNKNTEGLLMEVPLPLSMGLDKNSVVTTNAGTVNNKGIEITATFRKAINDFNFEIVGSFTKEKTEVTKFIQDVQSGSTQYYKFLTRTGLGHGIGDFYGYVFNGIYQIGDKDIPANLQPGDVKYKDLNNDGKITADDETYIGKAVPDYTFGLTLNTDWKMVDFSLFVTGVQGNQIFNHNRYHTEIFAKGFNQSTKALDAWTPWNPSNTLPRYTEQTTNNYSLPSSRFIEDGSYVRLQNMTLGCTLPKKIISRMHISKLRIYASVQNLLTLTKYTGMDPEINSIAPSWDLKKNTYRGIDNSLYPMAKTYVVGLELNF